MHAARLATATLALAALGLFPTPGISAPAAPPAAVSPAPWALDLAGGAQATLKQVKDESVVITVSAADSTDYHIRLTQAPTNLTDGNIYTVRFRAKADQPRDIKLYGQTDHGDFHAVGLDTAFQLSSQWTDYTFSFKATGAEPKHVSCPQFLLGSQTGTVSSPAFPYSSPGRNGFGGMASTAPRPRPQVSSGSFVTSIRVSVHLSRRARSRW